MRQRWYLFIPVITYKFRIREVTMQDGIKKFIPQVRFCGLWLNIRDHTFGIRGYANYSTLEDAGDYLCNITSEHRARTIKEVKNHPFNEVFQKLKS